MTTTPQRDPNRPKYTIRALKWTATKLEWVQSFRAGVPMGSYAVERVRDNSDEPWQPWKMSYCFDEYYDEGEQECSSLQEGKQLAWQDWLKRIVPALKEETQ